MDDGTRNGAGRWERRRAGRSDTQEPEGEAQLCTRHESWEQPSEAVDRAGLGSRDPGAQGRASCHLAELQDQQNAKEMLAAKQLAEKNQKDDETRQPGRRCERSAPHQWRARYSPRQGAGMTLNLYLLCVIAGRTGSHVVLFNVSERLYIRRRVLELARARGEMQ